MTTWTQPSNGWDPGPELAGTPLGDLLVHVVDTDHSVYGVITHLGDTTVWCGCGWPNPPLPWWRRPFRRP